MQPFALPTELTEAVEMREIITVPGALVPRAFDASLIEAWLSRYKPTTQDTYRRELVAFAGWLDVSAERAVEVLA